MEIEVDKQLHYHTFAAPFTLESGAVIPELTLAYSKLGKWHGNKPIVWVFHPVSANAQVQDWWSGLVGYEQFLNPSDYDILCVNALGSPYGSTKPENLSFPQFTVRDVAQTQIALAEVLGITQIHLAIGASFGGNQALEFAYAFPGHIAHLALLCSSARESPWGIAIHESQRMALQADPTFGTPGGGSAGMKSARAMALLHYRNAETYDATQQDSSEALDNPRAASYLQYQGDKFVKRFDALCYHYLSKCLDSHNIGRGRGGEVRALERIRAKTLVIGIKSDTLVPTRLQQYLAEHIPQAVYAEIDSTYGHDGFLVEHEKITQALQQFMEGAQPSGVQRSILKFGGKSLAGNKGLDQVLAIIQEEHEQNPVAVVVSARGASTQYLEQAYHKALVGDDFTENLEAFFAEQGTEVDLTKEREELEKRLAALQLLQSDDPFVYDAIVSFGELLAAKAVAASLQQQGHKAQFLDARKLIFTQSLLDDFEVNLAQSKSATQKAFAGLKAEVIPVVPGFIATSEKGKTVTLGKNGSNYTATLLASFIGAKEVQNWSNVPGLFSANPVLVPNAVPIQEISFRQANELANFGTHLLHPKTILPLLQSGIPLRLKSSLHPHEPGTLVSKEGSKRGIKAISVIEDVALVSIEGRGLLHNVGIDGRIFEALRSEKISVRLISQASSERGIGFVINSKDAQRAEMLLHQEFKEELRLQYISSINLKKDIAVLAIVGRHNYALEKAIHGLRRNRIWMHLISNSISGEHISLVIDKSKLKKAVQVVHNQVFGAIKTVHLFALGKGTVGGTLLDQIVSTSNQIIAERNLCIKVVGVSDSQRFVFDENGLDDQWRQRLQASEHANELATILQTLENSGLENVVIADNTSSQEITDAYPTFIDYGFDVVASNKKANSGPQAFYALLRKKLKQKGRLFYYETNVGAGLPIIDTIKHLYQSSDKITRIRGVFSGSLSYLFNTYSESELSFSEILQQADAMGYTEPDPREDLCGMDVARKLLILAREIGLELEYEDVAIENLVPEALRHVDSIEAFWEGAAVLDADFAARKAALPKGKALRYLGDLDAEARTLNVSLQTFDASEPIGAIKDADAIFEIFTRGYGAQPIVVQGAGAGADVTARGVYSDILKIGAQL